MNVADDDIDQSISLADAADEAERLTIRILEARDAYYERDTVVVADAEYDELDAPARGARAAASPSCRARTRRR